MRAGMILPRRQDRTVAIKRKGDQRLHGESDSSEDDENIMLSGARLPGGNHV
jgi:hypothetical protein